MTTASNLISSVNKKIHNAKAKLGGDSELLRIFNESLQDVRRDVDLISLKRTSDSFFLFDQVFEYAAPTDLAFEKAIQLVDERYNTFIVEKTQPSEFFASRNPFPIGRSSIGRRENSSFQNPLGSQRDGVYAVEFEDGDPYVLLRTNLDELQTTVLNNCDSYDGNGTFVGSSDATNVRTDNRTYKQGSGAVAFDSAGGTTTPVVTNSTMTAVDLSSHAGKNQVILYVKLPGVPTSITLKWGSDASNYYSSTVTTRKNGLALRTGWNLLAFDGPSATETGTVVDTAIAYTQLTVTNPSATAYVGYRIDWIISCVGREVALKYYSRYCVESSAGVRKALFTATDDTTVFREDEDNLFIEAAAIRALKELREFKEAEDRNMMYYKPMIEAYKAAMPSQQDVRGFSYHLL